ncbi:hypothetical protein JQN64_28620, partial [Escherichia coli]|nr:hypothetical protein [Escherichia coli]
MKPNFNEVELLLQKYNPLAICFKETFLKTSDHVNFKYFNLYSKFSSSNDERARGGVSILLNGNIPQSSVILNTPLEAVAVRITLHIPITVCPLYLYI